MSYAESDDYIKNKLSGNTILLRKKGVSYIMDASFGENGEDLFGIAVDSAAEESAVAYTHLTRPRKRIG